MRYLFSAHLPAYSKQKAEAIINISNQQVYGVYFTYKLSIVIKKFLTVMGLVKKIKHSAWYSLFV